MGIAVLFGRERITTRKLIALALAGALLVGLSACGAEQSVPQTEAPTVWDGTGTRQDWNSSQTAEDGADTYQQMLENGYVHDSDGILTDGENSRS